MSDHDNTNLSSKGPLSGFRVIELGSMVAGPFCGRLLADFGAEVIKVEASGGDPVRFMGSQKDGKSLYAASIFRNKQLLTLNLRTPEGQDVAKRLVASADIIIENFRPGTLERWGLGYEELKAVNPGIIMIRISGFGQTGPYKSRPGYGVVGEAVSGLREITGDPDRPPPRVAVSMADYISGLYAAFGGVMAALHRDRTGEGQVVDASLCEASYSFMEPHVVAYGALGKIAKRAGSELPNNVPNNLYPARGGYIHIAAVSKAIFSRFTALMGKPEIADDPKFSTALARNKNKEELESIIIEWTSKHDLQDLEKILIDADVPAARIYSIKDIFEDPYFRDRDMILDVEDPDLGQMTLPGIVPKLSLSPGNVRWTGRQAGADSYSVLKNLAGLDDTEIQQLVDDGTVEMKSE